MIIALFPNHHFEESFALAKKIALFLQKKQVQVVAESNVAKTIGCDSLEKESLENVDFMVAMGGDGTILRLFNKYRAKQAAIIGINLGHLGFMADIPVAEIFLALEDLVQERYKIQERIVLRCLSPDNKEYLAVNDIVLHRTKQGLIEARLGFKGVHMNSYTADGLIIATPNGSTAYSLAAGGPIISPAVKDVVAITPICAQSISNRSVILPAKGELTITYTSNKAPIEVSADGLDNFCLHYQETLRITRANEVFRLVSLPGKHYFATLRKKLGWSGTVLHNH